MSGTPPPTPAGPSGPPPSWPPAPGSPYPAFPYPPPTPKKRDNVALIIVLVIVFVLIVPVVIGAILYVMVGGLISGPPGGPGPTPKIMGLTISRSTDGTNWTLLITTASGGFTTAGTFLTIRSSGGSIALSAMAFDELAWAPDRAVYQGDGDGLIEPGESLLLSALQYPTNYRVEITDGTQILFSGLLA